MRSIHYVCEGVQAAGLPICANMTVKVALGTCYLYILLPPLGLMNFYDDVIMVLMFCNRAHVLLAASNLHHLLNTEGLA